MYFASKSLTAAQQNYVAIELEALAVSWAVQKFHHHLYGTSFTLQTDQKPLQAILSKSLVEATPWMQRLLLPTIPYDIPYLPNLTEHLKELVTNCRVCLKYSQANRKDSKSIGPSLGQEIPTRPWVKLATDIFTFNNQNYLLIVDYMSRFPVIRHLSNMTAKMVAEHMKAIFSELRIPKTLVSDNGPCYTGDQFKKTMSHLGIMHITTSLHHLQSNGLAEGYVRIIKNLLSKAKETYQDYHEVISVYRSTPLSNDLPSPFELLHGRKPSIDLPQWERKPKVNLEVHNSTRKEMASCHYSRISGPSVI